MADHKPGVYGQAPLKPVEILRACSPVPWNTCPQCLKRHSLDAGKHSSEIVGFRTLKGRNRKPTVATKNGRDAKQRRWTQRRIPKCLCIEMGMNINKPWSHNPIRRVNNMFGISKTRTDGNDP
jgi:hypothetical protein